MATTAVAAQLLSGMRILKVERANCPFHFQNSNFSQAMRLLQSRSGNLIGDRFPKWVELLNTLTHDSALSNHIVRSNKGFIFMLLRNLDPRHGQVSRTQYVVNT